MSEYYIGQKFVDMYPTDAAIWCNLNNAYIDEIKPIKDKRQFEIKAIQEHIPTWEEIDQIRVQYRKEHIDDRTIARMRKTANGTWTEEDEREYLTLDAEVTAWIEENLPYPAE